MSQDHVIDSSSDLTVCILLQLVIIFLMEVRMQLFLSIAGPHR